MPIVKIMKGDLLKKFKTGAFQAIAHGCNTQNLMGAGIADQIREQFPEAYEADKDFHFRISGAMDHKPCVQMGGELSIGHTKHGQVYNLYTQLKPGRNADYQLLQKAMENLNKFCKQRSIQSVGVPLIGAGIGGLDIIGALTVMSACTPDIDLTVVVWSQDAAAWNKAWFGYRNYSFPRKFEGVACGIPSEEGMMSCRTFETDTWFEMKLDPATSSAMKHNGEMSLSFSNDSPFKYLLIESKADFEKVKDRLYSK